MSRIVVALNVLVWLALLAVGAVTLVGWLR